MFVAKRWRGQMITIRQPETFAKPATDGAAARRHLANQQTLFNQPFGDEPSPLHFGFQAALRLTAA